MSFLKDHKRHNSTMRLITVLIVSFALGWGLIEVIASIIYKNYNVDFDIHESLILATISIGVTGKGSQKAIELFGEIKHKKSKDEKNESV